MLKSILFRHMILTVCTVGIISGFGKQSSACDVTEACVRMTLAIHELEQWGGESLAYNLALTRRQYAGDIASVTAQATRAKQSAENAVREFTELNIMAKPSEIAKAAAKVDETISKVEKFFDLVESGNKISNKLMFDVNIETLNPYSNKTGFIELLSKFDEKSLIRLAKHSGKVRYSAARYIYERIDEAKAARVGLDPIFDSVKERTVLALENEVSRLKRVYLTSNEAAKSMSGIGRSAAEAAGSWISRMAR